MVPRSFFAEHYAWETERVYSMAEAMLDLQKSASFAKSTRLVKGKVISLNVGELVASERYLEKRWGWSRTKIRTFKQLLKADQWIGQRKDQGETVLILLKYWGDEDHQQNKKPAKGPGENQQKTSKEPAKNQQRTKVEEGEEDKEGKKLKALSGSPDEKSIIDHLNSQTGRSFRYAEAHIKLIKVRLKETGVTVEGVKEMIDAQCGKWLLDDKMTEYLRPQTLFAKTKFANYYDQRNQQFKTGGTTDDDHAKGF